MNGAYTIFCEEKRLLQCADSAVSVKITRETAVKKVYSFNDLKDLESKIVLIRGRCTKSGEEIDRFLDVSGTVTSKAHTHTHTHTHTHARTHAHTHTTHTQYVICNS